MANTKFTIKNCLPLFIRNFRKTFVRKDTRHLALDKFLKDLALTQLPEMMFHYSWFEMLCRYKTAMIFFSYEFLSTRKGQTTVLN